MADYNPWQFPGAPPAYQQGYNPSQGLYNKFQGQINAINPDQRGMDKFRQEALRTGPSSWANMAGAQQNQLARNATSSVMGTAAGQAAQARGQLAMRGGLSGGARERLARGSAQDALMGAQGVNRDLAQNKMQIGMNDEQNRISQLGSLPGMETSWLSPQFDKMKMLGNAAQMDNASQAAEAGNQNAYNQDIYGKQMAGWAAGQQAAAMAHEDRGFLGLGAAAGPAKAGLVGAAGGGVAGWLPGIGIGKKLGWW